MEIYKLKNIFITGCGSGLGKSLLETGEKYDCNIFANIRSQSNSISGDINDQRFLDSLPDFLEKNKINVFINNAAIYKKDYFLNISDEEIKNIINTNLISQILIVKRVYNFFKKNQFGIIININSLAGKTPSAKESIYCASKSGLYAFSKALQLESINDNIEIIDVFPGAMKTKMTRYRDNYESFMDTGDVSKVIFDMIFNCENLFVNEIVIRKKNKKIGD